MVCRRKKQTDRLHRDKRSVYLIFGAELTAIPSAPLSFCARQLIYIQIFIGYLF